MPRYKLTIEYDGTPYCGWQRQQHEPSIQQTIETAASHLNKQETTIVGAGRTDTGVHATGQVAHLDMASDWSTDSLRDALNFHLKPQPIAILAAQAVPEDFHARFSAVRRVYHYRILNRRPPLTVDRGRAWRVSVRLDVEKMAQAAALLEGKHDFTTFRSVACQSASPVKTIDGVGVVRTGEEVRMEIVARSFLHNQVRSIMGSLKLVGAGKWRPTDLAAALHAKDRAACGPVAPAAGLYLTRVDY